MIDEKTDGQSASSPANEHDANQVGADDPHKTEKVTKLGRDIDPDEGSD